MSSTANQGGSLGLLRVAAVHARRCGQGLLFVTGLVWIGFVASFSIHRVTPIPEWKRAFDIGAEQNVPTWWNTVLLALVAVALLLAASIDHDERPARRRAWHVGALAAAYLSLDEGAGLHERLGGLTERSGIDPPTYAWLLPGVVLAAIGSVVLVRAGRALPHRLRVRLLVALAMFGTGAVGFEAITGWIISRVDDSVFFTIGIMIEEGLEMGACIVAVVSVLDAIGIEKTAGAVSAWIAEDAQQPAVRDSP